MFDLIIKKATVINGKNEKPFVADVGINNGQIAEIGNLKNQTATKDINAENLVLCPGFIDINNTADHNFTIFSYPEAENLIRQGVTTVVLGNYGASLAPLIKVSLANFSKWTNVDKINIDWQTIGEMFDFLENKKIGVNVSSLVGWGNIRNDLTEGEFRPLTKEELEKGKFLVEKSLKEGALGVSFGLGYAQEKMVGFSEIEKVAEIVKKYNGYLGFYLRDEEKNFLKSLEEIIEIVKTTQLPVEINRFQAKGEKNYPFFEEALKLIKKTNRNKKLIHFDFSPYEYSSEDIFQVLPEWVTIGGRTAFFRNIRDNDYRKKILEELSEKRDIYKKAIIVDANKCWWFNNLSIEEIANNFEFSIEETILEIAELCEGRATLLVKNISFDNIRLALTDPYSLIGSDNGFLNIEELEKKTWVHPAIFSAFIRFLKLFIQEGKRNSLEKAINKITYQPALKIGLKKRGLIDKGYWADLVLFNPKELKDLADMKNPFQYPLGIKTVIINGNLAYHKGILSSQRYGKVIRRN